MVILKMIKAITNFNENTKTQLSIHSSYLIVSFPLQYFIMFMFMFMLMLLFKFILMFLTLSCFVSLYINGYKLSVIAFLLTQKKKKKCELGL